MASNESSSLQHSATSARISAAVIAGCCAGDRSCQKRLYESCQGLIFRLMVRLVGVRDAEDLTQQVFLQLFRKLDQFAGDSQFDTWLYRLATNEAFQFLRKERRWKFQRLTVEPMSKQRPEQDAQEDRDLLEQALQRLNAELRAIFVLKEVEKLSYQEIAEVMNIPEGTVGSRLNRARSELQQHLTDLGWEA